MIATRRLALAARAAAARFARRRSCTRSGARLPAWFPLSLLWAPRRKRLSAKPAATSSGAAGIGTSAGLVTQVSHLHRHWHLALRVDREPHNATAVSPALGWVRHAVRTSATEWRRRIDPGLAPAAPGMVPRPPPQRADDARGSIGGTARPTARDDAGAASSPLAEPGPSPRGDGSGSPPVSLWSHRPLALVRRSGSSARTTAAPTSAAGASPPLAAWPGQRPATAQTTPALATRSVTRHALDPTEAPALPMSRRPHVGPSKSTRGAASSSAAAPSSARSSAPMERAPSSPPLAQPRNIAADAPPVVTPVTTWRRVVPTKQTTSRRTTALVWPPTTRNDRRGGDTNNAAAPSTWRRAAPPATPSSRHTAELVWSTRERGDLRAGDTAGSAYAAAGSASASGMSASATTTELTPQAATAAARALAAQRANPFDTALIDRLAEDVIRRVERRVRIERERRGL